MDWTGGCLCGSIRYQSSEAPNWASYCHCGMCRKATGAPVGAFVVFPDGAFTWTAGEAKRFTSSDGVVRRFCGDCGSSLTFEAPGVLCIALGTLDHPENVEIGQHCYTKFKLPWMTLNDGLPQYPGPVGNKGGKPVDFEPE